MYRSDLKGADLKTFHAALRGHHSIRIGVEVLSLDHDHLGDLSHRLLDGQVNIDADAETTRSASVSFLDVDRTLDFDSDSPANGALFANRQLRIEYKVKVEALDEWVVIPIFTGPIVKLDRSEDVVNVECQGKESLALGAAWRPMTVKKGTPKVDAIRRIMRERGGENLFDLPDLDARLPKAVSLGRESSPWKVARKIAIGMDDKQLYYDGRGRLRLRNRPGNALFTFSDGDGGEILAPPQIAFDIDAAKNIVWVKGGKPKATKRENETREEFETRQEKERGVRFSKVAPKAHPLSPDRLGRPGWPRFLLEVIENDTIRSEKEARKVATKRLDKLLREAVNVTFDSLVVPHLEEDDLVRVATDGLGMTFRLAQTSIPLRHDGVQSIGYLKNLRKLRHRGNRRRPNRPNRPRRGGNR